MRILCQNLNLHHLVSHSTDKAQRVTKFAQALSEKEYDVVVLQEVFVLNTIFSRVGGDLRDQLIEAGRRCGLQYASLSKPANPLFGQDAGLMVLSRFPIAREYSVTFREYGWKEVTNKKGFLHVVIDLTSTYDGDKTLHVLTSHLDAHEKIVRDNQVKQIRQHLSGHVSTEDHVILAGDFNIAAGTGEFKHLRNQVHPYRDGWGDLHPATTEHQSACLDYIFWSPNLTYDRQQVEDFSVSDHYALTATFDLVLNNRDRADVPK
jgi:endonuclease/exonuclease/phosphatase family metal-dependent hydrolase